MKEVHNVRIPIISEEKPYKAGWLQIKTPAVRTFTARF